MRVARGIRILLIACVLCVFGIGVSASLVPPHTFAFTEQLGTVWLFRDGEQVPPLTDQERCDDTPRIDYVTTQFAALPEAQTGSAEMQQLQQVFEKGRWAVRPLHIWGIYTEIGCKEPLGWGTITLAGMYKSLYIWVTIEHNVLTSKYFSGVFGRVVATNWYVQDQDGNFHELFLVGCEEPSACVLISSAFGDTFPVSLEEDYITNDVSPLDTTYVYGCSVVGETVKRYVHYRLHHFCIGNVGFVNSAQRIDTLVGGDALISNPAMPGMSGSPVFTYRDGRLMLVGAVNSGIEGVFTAIRFIRPDAVQKVKGWLRDGEGLFNRGQ